MKHDQIVEAVEAYRQQMHMAKWRFAQTNLGISASHYSALLGGHKQFNVRMLRELYALGISADILLGSATTNR